MRFPIHETILGNGLRFFHVQAPANDTTILACINAGSWYEHDGNAGISHLIEHCLFKGTQRRASRKEIYNEIRELGGEDVCYTDYTHVLFGLRVENEDVDAAADLVADLVLNAKMDPSDVESEKQIILDELRNRQDNPHVELWEAFFKEIFEGHPLARPQGGLPRIVERLTPEEVVQFYQDRFAPNNVALFLVGSQGFAKSVAMVEKYFGQVQRRGSEDVPKGVVPQNRAREIVLEKEMANVYLSLGKIVAGAMHEDFYALTVLAQVLSRFLSEKLLDEESLSYERGASYFSTSQVGVCSSYATCAKGNVQKVKEVIRRVWMQYQQGEIPEGYVNDAIRSLKKSFILRNATTMQKAQSCVNFWLLKKDAQVVNEYLFNLEKVTVRVIQQVAMRYLNPDDGTWVVLGG